MGQKYGSFNVGKFAPTATSNVDEQLAIDFSEISEVHPELLTRPGRLIDSKLMVELKIWVVIICHDDAVVVD